MTGPRMPGSGLTPAELTDQVLAKRIERVARPVDVEPDVDRLTRELRGTRLLLRVAWLVVGLQLALLVAEAGLRIAGL